MSETTFVRGKQEFYAIDLFKFLASFFVVAIHTSPLWSISQDLNFMLVNVVARLAVPFFFVSSGFLFFQKVFLEATADYGYLKRYVIRLTKLYCLWSLIYLPYDFSLLWEKTGSDVIRVLQLYVMDFFLTGSHFHLWFFPSLIFSICLTFVYIQYFSVVSLVFVSSLLYFIGLMGDSYYRLIFSEGPVFDFLNFLLEVFGTTRNGLFFGFLFIGIGAFIAKYSVKVDFKMACLLLGLFASLFLAEGLFLLAFGKAIYYNMLFFLPPLVMVVFYFIINLDLQKWNAFNVHDWFKFYNLRKYSTLIYCIHGVFIILYYKLLSTFRGLYIIEFSIIRFALIAFCSVFFSVVIAKSNLKTLKFLY